MFELKTLSKEAIPHSLERVERYRLLNKPSVSVSICQDILNVDPENQEALIGLILALTDQFAQAASGGMNKVLEIIPRLSEDYDRAYYTGIIYERQAKARLNRAYPGSGFDAYDIALLISNPASANYFKYIGMTGQLVYKNGKLARKSLKVEIQKGLFKLIGY